MPAKFTATSDFEKVHADYNKLQRENTKLKQTLAGVSSESAKGAKNQSRFGKQMAGSIKGAIAGYMGMQQAIAFVNAGLADQARLAKEANRVSLTAAAAQVEVVTNLGDVSDAASTRFLADVAKIAQEGGARSIAPVLEAAASTLSGVDSNQGLTKAILREAVPLFKTKLDELPDFAGAVGDLATITGAETQKEIQQTIGIVLSSQAAARITNLGAFKEAARAIAAVATVDDSGDAQRAVVQGGKLFAALSTAGKDPLGAETKTAVVNTAVRLKEFLATAGLNDTRVGGDTLASRIAYTQERARTDEGFAAKVGGLSFGRGASNAIVRSLLLNEKSEAARRFASVRVTADENRVINLRRKLDSLTPELAGSSAQARAKANIENLILKGGAAREGGSAEILNEALDKTNVRFRSFMTNQLQKGVFTSGSSILGDERMASLQLELRKRDLQRMGSGFGGMAQMGMNFLDPTRGAISGLIPAPKFLMSKGRRASIETIEQQQAILAELLEVNKRIEAQNAAAEAKKGASIAASTSIVANRETR